MLQRLPSLVLSVLYDIVVVMGHSTHKNHTMVSSTTNTTNTTETDTNGTGGTTTTPLSSLAFSTAATTTFRFASAAPTVAVMVWMGMTLISIKRNVLLQQQQQEQQLTRASPPNNHNNSTSSSSGTTSIDDATTAPPESTATATPIPKMSGRMILLNRMMDIFIYIGMAMFMIHEISIDPSTSHFMLQSLLSAGGIGALIFSLASKDLAMELVGGMTLGMYDIFHVGDRVRINESNMSGKVMEIGFVETTIQRYVGI